jgi:hypothetical protein
VDQSGKVQEGKKDAMDQHGPDPVPDPGLVTFPMDRIFGIADQSGGVFSLQIVQGEGPLLFSRTQKIIGIAHVHIQVG